MGNLYTSSFTVWPAGVTDPNYGDIIYNAPTVFKGLFRQGGNLKLTDPKGQEFLPTSTFWSNLEVIAGELFTPNNGDLILRGDHRSADNPASLGAQQIRGQTIEDNSMFGEPVDYIFGTK
ncbi:head-closure protein [Vibrio phage 1.210.O._10N.222.52.C2]|nr:head-closure protein [Vibrio phage 1.210.O._10N.222.52.C2]